MLRVLEFGAAAAAIWVLIIQLPKLVTVILEKKEKSAFKMVSLQ